MGKVTDISELPASFDSMRQMINVKHIQELKTWNMNTEACQDEKLLHLPIKVEQESGDGPSYFRGTVAHAQAMYFGVPIWHSYSTRNETTCVCLYGPGCDDADLDLFVLS